MSGITIGYHDTGIFDLRDAVKTDKKLATGLSPEEALQFAEENKGAELLVKTEGQHETAKFDVYSLSVGDGKTLTSDDIINHVSFVDDLPDKLGGESVSIAAITETQFRRDEPYTFVGHIQSEGKYNGKMHMDERIKHNMTYDH